MLRSVLESLIFHAVIIAALFAVICTATPEKEKTEPVRIVVIPTNIMDTTPEPPVKKQPEKRTEVLKREKKTTVRASKPKSEKPAQKRVAIKEEPAPEPVPVSKPEAKTEPAPAQTEEKESAGRNDGQKQSSGTAANASAGTQTAKSGSTAGSNELEQAYISGNYNYILALLRKKLEYPAQAKRMRWTGRVVLRFDVETDGRATNIRIENSSGYKVLDDSAAEAVRLAAPFPPPPVPATLLVPVSFNLRQ